MTFEQDTRLPVSAADVAFLTLGCWPAIAPGSRLSMYCGHCDDTEAELEVTSWHLAPADSCVVAEGSCRACGHPAQVAFGILDRQRLQAVLRRH
jgi:hypothetical protein